MTTMRTKMLLVLSLMVLLAVPAAYAQDQTTTQGPTVTQEQPTTPDQTVTPGQTTTSEQTAPACETNTTVQPVAPATGAGPACGMNPCPHNPPCATNPPCVTNPPCATPCPPYGQGPILKPLKWSIYAGAFFPTDSGTTDILGSVGADLYIGYKVPLIKTVPLDQELGVGVIWLPGETFDVNGVSIDTRAFIVPVTYTVRTIPANDRGFYYGLGVGAYIATIDGVATNGTVTESASDTSVHFGLKGLIGYQFTRTWGAEAGYHLIFGDIQDQSLSGFTIGLRAQF